MAFNANKIVKLARLPSPDGLAPELARWGYVTADALATTEAANYFDLFGAYLTVGDQIFVQASDGFREHKVATNTTQNAGGGHVTVNTSGGKRFVAGQITTGSAADTVVTGLTTVVSCGATLDDSPVVGAEWVSATLGDQAGTPAAGSIIVKTWKPTATNDATPVAATTTGKKVNWWAYGT